jgi:hypothetical protein
METGLFEIQAEHLREYRQNRQLLPDCREAMRAMFQRAESVSAYAPSCNGVNKMEAMLGSGMKADDSIVEFARSFLRLANLPNFALDRLSRYEATLWRQASQILYALEALDRRKPPERTRRLWPAGHNQIEEE